VTGIPGTTRHREGFSGAVARWAFKTISARFTAIRARSGRPVNLLVVREERLQGGSADEYKRRLRRTFKEGIIRVLPEFLKRNCR